MYIMVTLKELNASNRINKLKGKRKKTFNTSQCYCHSKGTKKARRRNRAMLGKYRLGQDNVFLQGYKSHWTLRNNHRGCNDICSLHMPKFSVCMV